MNIFLCDPCIEKCAQALDNVRLNKMIVETGQLLSTAYRYLFPSLSEGNYPVTLYKETHKNHPCNVWARDNINNYIWLLAYFNALHKEYYHRKHRRHLTWVTLNKVLSEPLDTVEGNPLETLKVDFTFDCSGIFDDKLDIFAKYRACLREKWRNDYNTPKWTKREPPEWSGI